MNRDVVRLAIVVPCFNEEDILNETFQTLIRILEIEIFEKHSIAEDSFILFVDDGSKDKTWDLIQNQYHENSLVKGLKLSRNFGHQKALIAGLTTASEYADCVISIDADLQDDPKIISEMIIQFKNGFEIVYGVRDNRDSDSFLKRTTAQSFYKIMRFLGVDMVYNHADYRLLSKRLIKSILEFKEVNLFLRALIPLAGYSHTNIYYTRFSRKAGVSKYPFKKMMSFAWDGITSFSVTPLRYISILGLVVTLLSIFLSLWAILESALGNTVWGWASTVLPIYFFSGVQLLSLGIVGEYLGKIYIEVKGRPLYFIDIKLL